MRGAWRDGSKRRYVDGRGRKTCRKCGTLIQVRAHRPHARLTYWCPGCQADALFPVADEAAPDRLHDDPLPLVSNPGYALS
jgi:hypothetical protein